MLPVSVLAYFLVFWGVVLGGKLLDFFSRPGTGWGANFFEVLAGPVFAGYWAIGAPMYIAPSNHRAVVLTLVALWFATYGALAGVAIFGQSWKELFAVLVSACGALVALVYQEFEA
jgi:exosortase/archaeosortase